MHSPGMCQSLALWWGHKSIESLFSWGSCSHGRDRKDTCSSRNMVGADIEACWEGDEQAHTKLLWSSFLSILGRVALGPPGYQGSVSSHVLLTILLTVLNAALMVCRCLYLILYWIVMRKMSQYIWNFFLNNFDPMLPESMDSGCWLLLATCVWCGGRQTDRHRAYK